MAAETMFGPVDVVLYDVIPFVLLGLVLLNGVTRRLAHRRHVEQSQSGGAEAVSRFRPHVAANALLLVAAFYYTTVSLGAGILLSIMVIGLVITDVFEFEARLVEARKEMPLDQPKGALAAWALAAVYAAYRSLFFVIEPIWDSVVV